MINSIGLPNKGLEGFLAADLPPLAELPVPLIVSVMGTSHDEFVRLVEGVAAGDEVAAIELNVSCPNVKSGLIVGEQPAETLSLLRGAAPADAQAADREADAQRRRPGRGRGRGGGGRGRRRVADQHAEGGRDRPGDAAALARRGQRRALGAGGAAGRAGSRCARSRRPSRFR